MKYGCFDKVFDGYITQLKSWLRKKVEEIIMNKCHIDVGLLWNAATYQYEVCIDYEYNYVRIVSPTVNGIIAYQKKYGGKTIYWTEYTFLIFRSTIEYLIIMSYNSSMGSSTPCTRTLHSLPMKVQLIKYMTRVSTL